MFTCSPTTDTPDITDIKIPEPVSDTMFSNRRVLVLRENGRRVGLSSYSIIDKAVNFHFEMVHQFRFRYSRKALAMTMAWLHRFAREAWDVVLLVIPRVHSNVIAFSLNSGFNILSVNDKFGGVFLGISRENIIKRFHCERAH